MPFWNIVLVTEHSAYRNLTEPELRFEAMQTLAFGARGLVWFTYWSPGEYDKTHTWSHAMINPDGTRDPHYDMVKAINADVLAIGRQLKRAEVGRRHATRRAARTSGSTSGESPVAVEAGKVTVGTFHESAGEQALRAGREPGLQGVDRREAPHRWRFGKKRRAIRPRVARRGRRSVPTGHVELTLPAGAGALLRW